MEKETNLFDLCKWFCKQIVRGILWLVSLLGKALQLTVQHVYIVLACILLAMGLMGYYSRPSNRTYEVQAVAILNGPTTEAVMDYFGALNGITQCTNKRLSRFESHYVIDCKHDGRADYVDWRDKQAPTDTFNVRMATQLGLSFRTKDIALLPETENFILNYLNSNPQFVQAYQTAIVSIERRYRFNLDQTEKLDSLTSAFYFEQPALDRASQPAAVVLGDRKIDLFLNEIDAFYQKRLLSEQMYTYREAPVVLVNHFRPVKRAVNDPVKCLPIGLVAGWLLGCIVAEIVRKRKKIIAYLKR